MIKKTIILCFILMLGSASYWIHEKISLLNKAEKLRDALPMTKFKTIDDKEFDWKKIPENLNLMIIYFSPDCGYCSEEIDDILIKKELFKSTFVALISPNTKKFLKEYIKGKNLTKYKNIVVLRDANNEFKINFGSDFIPTTILYNQQRRKIIKLEGSRSSDMLSALLKKKI